MEVRLTGGSLQDTTHPLFNSPNNSRRCALGARDVFLFGAKPMCSVQHCKDARVYDHRTTTIHNISTRPPPSPPPLRGYIPRMQAFPADARIESDEEEDIEGEEDEDVAPVPSTEETPPGSEKGGGGEGTTHVKKLGDAAEAGFTGTRRGFHVLKVSVF